jgi:hypothetical protein
VNQVTPANPTDRDSGRLRTMNAPKQIFFSERSYLILCIVLGAVQAWIFRYTMISDGVSYLDIGDAYLRGDWAAALNAYWSPMYSWCLGLALYLLKPSIWWEFITIHFVNLIIYLLALVCFRFFLHSVLRALKEQTTTESDDSVPLSEGALIALGYCLFLWCSLVLIEVGRVTPDLLVAAVVFLIAGYLVELRVHHSYWKFALFGALSGAAYLGKGIMFPLGFGFLAILLFSGKRSRARICGVLLSGVVFLMVCSPFIFALSKAKGRLTFGDTGKVAYAAMVSPGTPLIHWQGEPAGSGVPRHPTRKLMDDPPVFEFGEPVRGSYPPWDDPSYWNEGVQPRFHLRAQLRVLVLSALAYERFLLAESGLLAGVLIFLFIGGKSTRSAIAFNWPLLAAACLSLGAYSLVLVVNRYIGASMVLLFVAIFAGIRLPKGAKFESESKYVAAAIAIAVLLTVAGHIVDNAYTTLTVGAEPPGKDQIKAAVGLENMGLRAGDKVAVVGYGIFNHWARLGRFKIVAEAAALGLPSRDFWAESPERRNSAYECLSRAGARAVIAWDPPASALDPRWQRISDTGYYAYFFHK